MCVKKESKEAKKYAQNLFSQHRERIKVMNLKESTDKKSTALWELQPYVKRPD